MNIELKLNLNKNTISQVSKAIQNAVLVGTIEVQNRAKENCPVESGDLRDSIKRQIKGYTGRVYTNMIYAKAVEYGLPARIIRPKKAKALFWEGAEYPVKIVHHPGFKGRFYMKHAIYDEPSKIKNAMQKALNAGLK